MDESLKKVKARPIYLRGPALSEMPVVVAGNYKVRSEQCSKLESLVRHARWDIHNSILYLTIDEDRHFTVQEWIERSQLTSFSDNISITFIDGLAETLTVFTFPIADLVEHNADPGKISDRNDLFVHSVAFKFYRFEKTVTKLADLQDETREQAD